MQCHSQENAARTPVWEKHRHERRKWPRSQRPSTVPRSRRPSRPPTTSMIMIRLTACWTDEKSTRRQQSERIGQDRMRFRPIRKKGGGSDGRRVHLTMPLTMHFPMHLIIIISMHLLGIKYVRYVSVNVSSVYQKVMNSLHTHHDREKG